jgi:hypothetical protein
MSGKTKKVLDMIPKSTYGRVLAMAASCKGDERFCFGGKILAEVLFLVRAEPSSWGKG